MVTAEPRPEKKTEAPSKATPEAFLTHPEIVKNDGGFWVTVMVRGLPCTPEGDVAVTVTVAVRCDPAPIFCAIIVKLPGVEPLGVETVSQSVFEETTE